MKRLVGASIAAILFFGLPLNGDEEEKQKLKSNIDMDSFINAFGRDSEYAQPPYIMRLQSGYLIGYEKLEYDKINRTVRFSKCSVVMRLRDGDSSRSSVAIASKSGVVLVDPRGRDFYKAMTESIRSIKFHDGSSFIFPQGVVQQPQ